MKVWVVFVGNYFPREVEGIYSNEAAAEAHVEGDDDDSLDYEVWDVAEKYVPDPLDPRHPDAISSAAKGENTQSSHREPE